MNDQENRFAPVVEEYARIEPDGTDSWSPLNSDRELLHRLTLYEQLCYALRLGGPVDQLRVLDVGCGNGRSTRIYLDFGLTPDQLMGVDLRGEAIDIARHHHRDIRYVAYDGRTLPAEAESMNWVSVCTVMSSIPGPEARHHLANEIVRVLSPGGVVFYWDRTRAKRFAGGDALEPSLLFPSLAMMSDEQLRIKGGIDRDFPGTALRRTLLRIAGRLATPRTHRVSVLSKPSASLEAPG